MDSITLKGLYFFGYHGVLEEEKKLGQRFLVDLELFSNLERPGKSDDLKDSIDYAAVYSLARQIVEEECYDLIEAVAERIAVRVLDEFEAVKVIDVSIKKPQAPLPGIFVYVGVNIRRGEVERG